MPYADLEARNRMRRERYAQDSSARRAENAAWREANREKDRAAKRAYKRRMRDWLNGIKRELGCIDCGTREGRLDFDHRPGTVKLFNPSRLDRGRQAIVAEIAKCDVRCVACHAGRHGRGRGGLNA